MTYTIKFNDETTNQTIHDPRLRLRGHNQRQRQSKADAPGPETQAQKEGKQVTYRAAYAAALVLVDRIEPGPNGGLAKAYRNKAGARLTTLNELVNAILNDDLMGFEAEPVLSKVEGPVLSSIKGTELRAAA